MFSNALKRMGIKKYSIEDLPPAEKKDITKLRRDLKIVIIDDEKDLEEDFLGLVNTGFDVKFMHDIETIDSIALYDIIFCDIQGVGTKLNKKLEGAFVIDEIRKQYSNKILIGFTSKLHDANFNIYFSRCDKMLMKDALGATFTDIIDDFIDKLHTPKWVWYRNRKKLIEHDLPTYQILDIEDTLVRSINSNSNLFSAKYLNAYTEPVRNIVYNITSSLIFKALGG